MMMRIAVAVAVAALMGLATANDLALAQSGVPAVTTGTAASGPGLGLTPENKKIIADNTGNEQSKGVPAEKPAIGETIPDAVMLNEMPVSVKDQIGALRDFKFARLQDASVLIVDPVNRKIVDVVENDPAEKGESGAK